jgi:hypothetical protein
MKRPRKVALISVHDYPREDYSAYWAIEVSGSDEEGYRWAARIFSHEPVAWEWKGTKYTTRPEAPTPVYPEPVKITQAKYLLLDAVAQEKVRFSQDAWREACAKVYEAHPKALHLVDEALDVVKTRDEADTAAQTWVLERMPKYRRPNLPTLTDAEIEASRLEYDAARARAEFGRCDQIRGRLRSRGVVLTAPEKASDTASSKISRQKGFALALGPAGLVGVAIADLFGELAGKARDLVLMALGYSTTVRNERLQRVQVNIDLGAGAGLFRIYDGTRPATCGTATTKLAELTFTDPCAPSASGGVLTMSAITADASADATGTATWFRCVDSTGTCCVDGAVGTSGSDLNLNTTSINTGVQVSVSSFTITAGNA